MEALLAIGARPRQGAPRTESAPATAPGGQRRSGRVVAAVEAEPRTRDVLPVRASGRRRVPAVPRSGRNRQLSVGWLGDRGSAATATGGLPDQLLGCDRRAGTRTRTRSWSSGRHGSPETAVV